MATHALASPRPALAGEPGSVVLLLSDTEHKGLRTTLAVATVAIFVAGFAIGRFSVRKRRR